MKKTALLLIAATMLLASANAQITKGQKMVGGNLSFSSTKEDPTFAGESKSTIVSIAPEIGFGLSGNWVLGTGVFFHHQANKYISGINDSKQVTNIAGLNIFARKFHPFRENIGIFGQFDIGAGFGKLKETMGQGGGVASAEADISTVIGRLAPGFYFKPTRRLILEAGFGGVSYTATTSKPEGGTKYINNEFNFSLTSSISLSFRVIL